MNDEVVNRIFDCLCSRCGENSGGPGFLAVNENGEETPIMLCWKCLAEKAAEMFTDKPIERKRREHTIEGQESFFKE